jgi:hypothetical protein
VPLTDHHAMKTYWGSECIAPRILDLGTKWRWVVSFMLLPFYPQRESPWYPLDRRLGGPHIRSGRGGEDKNSQPLPGLELPIIQSVAQRCTTEISRLLYVILNDDDMEPGYLSGTALNNNILYETCLQFQAVKCYWLEQDSILWPFVQIRQLNINNTRCVGLRGVVMFWPEFLVAGYGLAWLHISSFYPRQSFRIICNSFIRNFVWVWNSACYNNGRTYRVIQNYCQGFRGL